MDAAAGEVVAALRERDVDSILLKGATLRDWYESAARRAYLDADVLVAPANVLVAGEALRALGFQPTRDERGLPEWWLEHGSSWRRAQDGGAIDLHRRLHGVGVEPEAAWMKLRANTVALRVGGVDALRLSDPALAFHVAVHAAHHRVGPGESAPHLDAGITALDDEIWGRAWELAQELEAADMFCTGLRRTAHGAALAERLGIPEIVSVRSALHARDTSAIALGFDHLASASWKRRPAIVLRKFVPPPGFIKHWWPPAARSRRLLVVGYLYRPIWLCKKAPASYRAWRDARRDVSSSE